MLSYSSTEMSSPVLDTIRPRSDRVLPGAAQRDERVVALVVREVEPGRPAGQLASRVARLLELRDERAQLCGGRRAVEAADAEVDRVHLAAAD